MGELRLLLVNEKTGKLTTIFSKDGAEVDKWMNALIRLSPNDIENDFRIIIEANLISYYNGGKQIYLDKCLF